MEGDYWAPFNFFNIRIYRFQNKQGYFSHYKYISLFLLM